MPETTAARAFFPARPAISVDGVRDPGLESGLLSLSVHESSDGLYRCESTFTNWGSGNGSVGFLYFDRTLLDFGKTLRVEMGDADAAAQIFEGRITALEGRFPQQSPPELLVLAEDRMQDLRMVRKSRSFEQISFSDLVSQIAGEHGLQSQVAVSGPSFSLITQLNLSDLAFLRDCARRVDAELWLRDGTLHAATRGRRASGDPLTLTYGRRLREFAVNADLAGQRTALVTSGWDVAAKEGLEHRADNQALGSELLGTTGGGEILQQQFGERVERIVHEVPLDADEARAFAEAAYRQRARRFLCGHGRCEGDGRIRVGTQLRLEGLGPLFSGRYYVTEANHSYDVHHGYQTAFRVERAGIGSGT